MSAARTAPGSVSPDPGSFHRFTGSCLGGKTNPLVIGGEASGPPAPAPVRYSGPAPVRLISIGVWLGPVGQLDLLDDYAARTIGPYPDPAAVCETGLEEGPLRDGDPT